MARISAVASATSASKRQSPVRGRRAQNPYVERLIGSVRRDCLDHVIVVNEQHLRWLMKRYLEYYHRSRCHLSLDGDAPIPRAIQRPDLGRVIELPEVGGLHHRYVREAA